MKEKRKIGIIGGGSWGTAIAQLIAKNNHQVTICSRNQTVVDSINNDHSNSVYFDDITLSNNINATLNAKDLSDCEYIFLVIPTQSIREFIISNHVPKNIPLILCNKGIELETLKFTSEIVTSLLDNPVLMLSGPNFAREIISNLPARANIISQSTDYHSEIIALFDQEFFKLESCFDLIGAEICGALKNILAIGCGMIQGMKLGENAKAMFLTKGINDIATLISAKSGNNNTIFEYCGIGDIMLTCNSILSRNTNFGFNYVQSGKHISNTVEGYETAKSAYMLAKQLGINTPIIDKIYNILYNNENINNLINIEA
jgi:glycerol-3-phosphate dehydrogenase (NAD(P)+)